MSRGTAGCVQKDVSLSFTLGGTAGAPRAAGGQGVGVGGLRGSGPLRTSSWQRSTKLPEPPLRGSAWGGLGLPRRTHREGLLEAEWRLEGQGGELVRGCPLLFPSLTAHMGCWDHTYLVREAWGEGLGKEPREEASGVSSHCSSCSISSCSVRPPTGGDQEARSRVTGQESQGTCWAVVWTWEGYTGWGCVGRLGAQQGSGTWGLAQPIHGGGQVPHGQTAVGLAGEQVAARPGAQAAGGLTLQHGEGGGGRAVHGAHGADPKEQCPLALHPNPWPKPRAACPLPAQ